MKQSTVYIGLRDGREWDCQCGRCGSSLDFDECEVCGGEGYDDHDCGEDSCCCAFPENNVRCEACAGRGAWPRCASGYEWCRAHPRPGCESIEPSTPEWYVVPMGEIERGGGS